MYIDVPIPKLNHKKLFIVSVGMLVFGVGFGFYAFPRLLKKAITSQIQVSKSSKIRGLYTDTPFFIEFRIYLFNVTNKDEIIQGKKPKLQELGPYFFEEWKKKFDLVDDEEEDTLTYHYSNTFIFRPDLSGPGITGNEHIIMLHPFLSGLFLATNVDKKPMRKTVENVSNSMFHNPTDVFFEGKVMDLLFGHAIIIDCGGEDKTAGAICVALADEIPFRKVDDDHLSFSLFGGANGTDLGEIKVYRGKKNYRDVARFISFNDDTESNAWGEAEECNRYRGTDTTIVPSYVEKGQALWGYDPLICRPLAITHQKFTKYHGINVALYGGENFRQCYCREDGTCPPKGTFYMFRCSSVPMIGSAPHFYKAEQLLSGIESGLNPNHKDHGVDVYVDLMTGVVVSAFKRLQFSMEVKPIPEIEIMKTMPECYFPLFWLEEGLSLTKRDRTMMRIFYMVVKFIHILKWLGTIFGAIGIVSSLIMMMMASKNDSNKIVWTK